MVLTELRRKIADYLSGQLELGAFEDWFVDVLWEADPCTDPILASLAGRVHVLLAEYSREDRTLESVHRELAAIRPFEVQELIKLKIRNVESVAHLHALKPGPAPPQREHDYTVAHSASSPKKPPLPQSFAWDSTAVRV